MVGNIQADNNGDVYVEFDYNNIIVVDPNKTIDSTGKVKERLLDHENLVMYANLQAEVLPRTKLALGVSPGSGLQVISVARLNFLKPTKDDNLTTGYYDELTGRNTTKGDGQNQTKEILNGNGAQTGYQRTVVDESNIIDNGLLGITNINITTNSSFIPSVTMELEDVQGKALFELGNKSPYSVFFNLPYPQFYLTLKGYFGQAIRYQLNLEKFNARFNSFSGNYQVTLQFKGYKFNILNEIAIGHLLATPHMYTKTFTTTNTENTSTSDQVVSTTTSEKGYQKIRELYSEYKAKGLIDKNLPELTLVQLMNKLENFENLIINSYPKANLEPLTNIRNYKNTLKQYYEAVRGQRLSWFVKYMDPNPIFLKDGVSKVYVFKKEFTSEEVKNTANSELEDIIKRYNDTLEENNTLGKNGLVPIKNKIKFSSGSGGNNSLLVILQYNNIDWEKTSQFQTGSLNEEIVRQVKKSYDYLFYNPKLEITDDGKLQEVRINSYLFEGKNRFDEEIISMEAQANKKLAEYETSITADLARRLQDSEIGIGFKPTVRNITAVIMASTEAFIRLLDDVHTSAWNVKYDNVRSNVILNNDKSAPGVELKNEGENNPVYPWPQFFVETAEDRKGRFQLKYIGDPSVIDATQGYLFEKWPEVEFVEEYMKGITKKFDSPYFPDVLENQRETNQINVNPIEYPDTGISYLNKEEVKFFYEIWERQFLTANYNGLIRDKNNVNKLIDLVGDVESQNIKNSLGLNSPYLVFSLKNYNLTPQNYLEVLQSISNGGTGRSWQDFSRDFFVTRYLRTITENSFSILQTNELGKLPQFSPDEEGLVLLARSVSNEPLIIDTLPFTDANWVTNNMAGSRKNQGNQVYNTNKSYKVFGPKNILSNFTDVFNFTECRPVTNFSYLKEPVNLTPTTNSLNSFYFNRINNQDLLLPTEGYLTQFTPINNNPISVTGLFSGQIEGEKTTSILNTPYFVNSIMNGVGLQKQGSPYPYVQSAYLFINSLPLISLKEKYKKYENGVGNDLDYMASVLKKYAAIHKVPYAWVLKIGSIWHRYKKFKEDGVDILESAWKDFDYVSNYSPILKSEQQVYSIQYGTNSTDIVLEETSNNSITMNVGFYPKVINDFNYFYNGIQNYLNYTNEEIQSSINNGLKIHNFSSSNMVGVNQNGVTLNQKTWSVLIPEFSFENDNNKTCSLPDNTNGLQYFITPSFGTQINQAYYECVGNKNSTQNALVNITSNKNVYNGSVRSLWGASNYGYFDNTQVKMPPVDSYVNKIKEDDKQDPFRLLTNDEYSKIDEIFSVFEKKVLDKFEEEFLNFSKIKTDAPVLPGIVTFDDSTYDNTYQFRNFQVLYTNLMSVRPQDGNNNDQYFSNVINEQISNFGTTIRSFLEYDVLLRYGNPSNYNRRVFSSYLSYQTTTLEVFDPINFNPYILGSLPSKSGVTTLSESILLNPEAWRTLELEVGFSTIPSAIYSDQGSTITDFFIDNNIEFSKRNIELLSPIIKMYATQKLKNPNINAADFKEQLNSYLTETSNLQNIILDNVLTKINKILPNQQQLPERTLQSAIEGQQSKIENYEIFKALNDKWIAGSDFTEKTLFEDMIFLDRASRNIGDLILLDIFDLKNMFSKNSLNNAMSVFTFISSILIKNNFTVMNLPAYVNFYNVQSDDGVTIPKTEGSLQFANSMWGTFLDVDYRKSSPKMVCFFVGKPSEHLYLPNSDYRFGNDGFEIRRYSDNPLIENQENKKDWAISNRCVGFNVDIGTRNQNIFYSFSVDQNPGKATSESINTQLYMINQSSGRESATQNVSLYNYYKLRSYQSTIVSMGNALIQPTMYYNLRHVPMFNGTYMILSVEHSIQPGNFQTQFTGVRQSVYDLPAIDNFLQQVNKNLLTRLQQLVKIKDDVPTNSAINQTESGKSRNVIQKAESTKATQNSCLSKLNSYYSQQQYDRAYISKEAVETKITPKEMANILNEKMPNNFGARATIYCICYVRTFKSGNFTSFDNNFATLTLNERITPEEFYSRTFSCVNLRPNKPEPIANFENLDKFISFMESKITPNVDRIVDSIGLLQYYVCNWQSNQNITTDYFSKNRTEFDDVRKNLYEGLLSAINSGAITKEEANILENRIKITGSQESTIEVEDIEIVELCPRPQITSIFPKSGTTGTIIQVNGNYLLTTKNIIVNNQNVDMKLTQIFNDETLRFSVPVSSDQLPTTGKIKIITEYGDVISDIEFTHL